MADKKQLSMISLAWPILIENILRMSLGSVNIFMLSLYSVQAVSAVGASNDVMRMVIVMFGIISVGTTVILNQYLGSGLNRDAQRISSISLTANLVLGLSVSSLIFIFAEPILVFVNLPEDLIPIGIIYTKIVGAAMFTQALIAALSGISRSYGQTKFPMFVALIMNVINLVGNAIVIFRPFGIPDFGVTGIAVSHVIAEVVALGILVHFLHREAILKFKWADIVPFRFDLLKKIMKIGLPSAGEFISYSATQLATTIIVASLGTTALALKIVTQNMMHFVWVIGLAIGQASLIIVGHQIGQRKWDEAYKLVLKNVKLAILVDVGFAILLALAAKPILGLFIDDPYMLEIGVVLLAITILLEPGRAYNLVIANSLRGAGDVRFPVIMGIISMWAIGVPLCYVLGISVGWGLVGVWISFVIEEWVRGIIMLLRWRSGKWREFRLVDDQEMKRGMEQETAQDSLGEENVSEVSAEKSDLPISK